MLAWVRHLIIPPFATARQSRQSPSVWVPRLAQVGADGGDTAAVVVSYVGYERVVVVILTSDAATKRNEPGYKLNGAPKSEWSARNLPSEHDVLLPPGSVR